MASKRRPLAQIEQRISKHLRSWRENAMLPATKVAQSIGATYCGYLTHERAITPLPWGIFVKLYLKFGLMPRYLYTGQGEKTTGLPLASGLPHADAKARFSDVYREKMAEDQERIHGGIAAGRLKLMSKNTLTKEEADAVVAPYSHIFNTAGRALMVDWVLGDPEGAKRILSVLKPLTPEEQAARQEAAERIIAPYAKCFTTDAAKAALMSFAYRKPDALMGFLTAQFPYINPEGA